MIPNSTFNLSSGGNFMLSTFRKCQGCGLICDEALIYWNIPENKEKCYFEIKKHRQEVLKCKNEAQEEQDEVGN